MDRISITAFILNNRIYIKKGKNYVDLPLGANNLVSKISVISGDKTGKNDCIIALNNEGVLLKIEFEENRFNSDVISGPFFVRDFTTTSFNDKTTLYFLSDTSDIVQIDVDNGSHEPKIIGSRKNVVLSKIAGASFDNNPHIACLDNEGNIWGTSYFINNFMFEKNFKSNSFLTQITKYIQFETICIQQALFFAFDSNHKIYACGTDDFGFIPLKQGIFSDMGLEFSLLETGRFRFKNVAILSWVMYEAVNYLDTEGNLWKLKDLGDEEFGELEIYETGVKSILYSDETDIFVEKFDKSVYHSDGRTLKKVLN